MLQFNSTGQYKEYNLNNLKRGTGKHTHRDGSKKWEHMRHCAVCAWATDPARMRCLVAQPRIDMQAKGTTASLLSALTHLLCLCGAGAQVWCADDVRAVQQLVVLEVWWLLREHVKGCLGDL